MSFNRDTVRRIKRLEKALTKTSLREQLPSVGIVEFNGSGAPSGGLGSDGDYYLDNDTNDIYFKASGSWSVITNITGATGAAGADGAQWHSGSGVPSAGLGSNGDFYLNTDNEDVYEKSGGSWSVITNIKGDTGGTGDPGAVWRSGSGTPSNGLGVDGDFYLDTDDGEIFEKSGGTYSLVFTIVGGAPTGVSYIALGTDANLTAERVLTPGTNINGVDGGAGSTYTLNVPSSSTTTAGAVEQATQSEVDTGTDNARFITPQGLASVPVDHLKVSKLRESDDGADALTANATGDLEVTSGDLSLAGSGKDIYLEYDSDLGIGAKTTAGYTDIVDHFDGTSLDVAWGWETGYGGLITPGQVSLTDVPSNLVLSQTTSASNPKSFLRRTDNLTRSLFGFGLVLNAPADLLYSGCRFDDGTDNNYVECAIRKTSGADTLEAISVIRTGGGSVTTTVHVTIYDWPKYVVVRLQNVGTQWSNWTALLGFGIDAQAVRNFTVGSSLSWTPSNRGLVLFRNGTTPTSTFTGPFVDYMFQGA